MTSRARVLRIVTLAVVLVAGAAVAAALSSGIAPQVPSQAAPTHVLTATATPQVTAAPSAPPVVTVDPTPSAAPEDDPATVFVEEDFAELPPVELDETAEYGNDVTVTLERVERVDGAGAGPGEVAGPAVLVTVKLHNGSRDKVDLGAVVVDLYTAAGALGSPLLGDERTAPFEGVAAPGDAVTASYVMRVPDDSAQIKVTVSYEAQTPAVTFVGEA